MIYKFSINYDDTLTVVVSGNMDLEEAEEAAKKLYPNDTVKIFTISK